jgi:hypothetical protein
MMKVRSYPTLMLALMGSMDCLTTVVGILYFGAVELNPLISGIVSKNIVAFVGLKMMSTVFVCLVFVQAEKVLTKTSDKTTRAYSWTRKLLKAAYIGVLAFLVLVVANNAMVLAHAI